MFGQAIQENLYEQNASGEAVLHKERFSARFSKRFSLFPQGFPRPREGRKGLFHAVFHFFHRVFHNAEAKTLYETYCIHTHFGSFWGKQGLARFFMESESRSLVYFAQQEWPGGKAISKLEKAGAEFSTFWGAAASTGGKQRFSTLSTKRKWKGKTETDVATMKIYCKNKRCCEK